MLISVETSPLLPPEVSTIAILGGDALFLFLAPKNGHEITSQWGGNLDGIDWGELFERLCAYGMGKMRLNPADAEQVAQEALRRFLDPEYAGWDRQKEPDLSSAPRQRLQRHPTRHAGEEELQT